MSVDAHEAEYRRRLQAALGDGFELRENVGRGGFGAVYAAWDKTLEREVAVKALRHDLFPTPVVLERFRREAKALAQLRHPHILPVYEVGDGEGLAFMIMPFIRGDNLRVATTGGRALDTRDAVRIVGEVARALDAAHRVGIVHRDVKPENILLDGVDRHAVLADFGIAKAAPGEAGLTGTGVAIGSPEYMSPEQAAADKAVDARSDIYSLGIVAYELLSGRRPYEAASLQRLLVLQMTTEPALLASIAPSVPAHVSGAVMRSLAREPADRWPTAGEFGAAISAARETAEVPKRESWFARPARRRWAGAAVVVALGLWLGNRALSPRHPDLGTKAIAVLPCENASGDSSADYLAEGLSDELRSQLTQVVGLSVKARTSSLAFRGSQVDYGRVSSKLAVHEVLQCSVHTSGGQLRVTAELVRVPAGELRWAHTYFGSTASFQALRDSISRAVAGQLSRLGGSRPDQLLRGTSDHDAYILFLKGEFHRRKWDLPAAIALFRQVVARDPTFVRALGALAASYAMLPILGFASPDSTRSLAVVAATRALALDSTDALALSAEALFLYWDLRMADAEILFARAVERDSTNADAMIWQALALGWLGRLDEALAVSMSARRHDPLSVDALSIEPYVLHVQRRFRAAIDETRPALEVDPNWVVALENLAVAYAFAGQPDSTVAVARRVVSLGATNFGGRAYLMFAFAAAGHWGEADEQRRLLAAEAGNSPEFNRAFTNLVYGQREAAVTALERAFRNREPLIAINFIACDPMWDPLKSDPRFTQLLTSRGAVVCPALAAWPIGKRP